MAEQPDFLADRAAKGGRARAVALTAEQRREIARKAAARRWNKGPVLRSTDDQSKAKENLRASYSRGTPVSSFEGQIHIAKRKVSCFVLSDGTRVVERDQIVRLFPGTGKTEAALSKFLPKNAYIEFADKSSDRRSGINAESLLSACAKLIKRKQRLNKEQSKLAVHAQELIVGSMPVGFLGRIDRATGYERFSRKRELATILAASIARDCHKWTALFPSEFWRQLSRLEHTRYAPTSQPMRWVAYISTISDYALSRIPESAYRLLLRRVETETVQDEIREAVAPVLQDLLVVLTDDMRNSENIHDFRTKLDQLLETPQRPEDPTLSPRRQRIA